MNGGVTRAALYLVFFALNAPWWAPLVRALLADVRRAADEPEALPRLAPRPLGAPRLVDADTKAPLNRVLAFRGVARRVAARRRWEAGFGRRGL